MMEKLSQKLLETHPFKLKSNIETGLNILLLLVIFLVPDLGSLHFSVIALRSFSSVLKFAYLLTLNILSFASLRLSLKEEEEKLILASDFALLILPLKLILFKGSGK